MWCGARLANKPTRISLHDKKNPRGRSRCDDRDALQLSKGSYVRGIAHIIAIIGAASSPWRGNLVPLYPVLSFVVLGDTICPYRVGRGRASVRQCVRVYACTWLTCKRGSALTRGKVGLFLHFHFFLLLLRARTGAWRVESGEWREGRRKKGENEGRRGAETRRTTRRRDE